MRQRMPTPQGTNLDYKLWPLTWGKYEGVSESGLAVCLSDRKKVSTVGTAFHLRLFIG
jgi:hypothetical protein